MGRRCLKKTQRNLEITARSMGQISRMTLSRHLYIALLCAALSFAMVAPSYEQQPTTRVDAVVVGSGISGIAAARHIHNKNPSAKVVVLEARNRTGGRIYTVTSKAGVKLDLGAAWVHGDEGNPLMDLLAKAKIKTWTSGEDTTWFGPDNREMSDAQVDQLDQLLEQFAAFRQARDWNMSQPLMDVYNAFVSSKRLEPAVQRALRSNINTDIEQEYAGSLSELSAAFYDQDEGYEGDDLLPQTGYKSLIDWLVGLRPVLDIRLNQEVAGIDYQGQQVLVRTRAGATFSARAVIVTMPAGYLKRNHQSIFTPALPEVKVKAIQQIGMGLLKKVIMVFDKPYWKEVITTDWADRVTEPPGAFNEFYNLYRPTGLPIVIALTGAEYGWQLGSKSDAEVAASALASFRAILAPEGVTLPNPVETFVTRWDKDPFTFGSYSFIKAGAPQQIYRQLAAPTAGKVFFAGEHTNQENPARVDGAFLSGVRAATEVLKALAAPARSG